MSRHTADGEARPNETADTTAVAAALGTILGTSCEVRAIGRGAQACVYGVVDAAGDPIRMDGEEILAKVYFASQSHPGVAQEEAWRLEGLHRTLQGRVVGGWTVTVPRPVAVSDDPSVLVMTRVPGDTARSLLRRRQTGTECTRAVASVIASCLETYWRVRSDIYGDLQLENILCDPDERIIGFIDPGVLTQPVYACPGVPTRWFPASRDVAFLLFEIATTNAKLLLTSPSTFIKQNVLARTILRQVVLDGRSPAQVSGFLDEVRACAAVRVGNIDPLDWRRGFWGAWLKVVAAQQLSMWLSGVSGARSAEGWLRAVTRPLIHSRGRV